MKNLIVLFSTIFIFWSCSKKQNASETLNLRTEGAPLEVRIISSLNTSKKNVANSTLCNSVGIGRAWNIALCKRNCNGGFGFRCGGYLYTSCDGNVDQVISIISPTRACREKFVERSASELTQSRIANNTTISDTTYSRPARANFEFYQNGVLTMSFTNSIAIYSDGSNVFEVEEDTGLYCPGSTINGVSCSWIIVEKGNYLIDFSLGSFGSVNVSYRLL